MRINKRGNIFAINEGYAQYWSSDVTEYVQKCKFPGVSYRSDYGVTVMYTPKYRVFCQNWLRKNFPFLLHFLMHIHVLMLCSKFGLIPIKFGFFTNF